MTRISKDIDIAHQRRWPGRPMSLATRLWLLIISSGLQLMLFYRIDRWLYLKRQQDSGGIRKWLWRILFIPLKLIKLAITIRSKSVIEMVCEIEEGVSFSDQGHMICGARKIGTGTLIGTRVTFGRSHVDGRCPEIGRNVWIGSDCVIYGGIRIGDGATLMPGTVLTKSIPEGVVMQGNPVRLVLRDFDNSQLRKCQDVDAIQYVNTKWGGG